MTGAELDDLAARFEAAAIPRAAWTHQAHLHVAAWYVERFGPTEALAHLRTGIRRLSDVHRRCDMQTSGYHDPDTGYRLWVSQDRLTKVKLWANGRLTVSSRRTVRDRWGTPMSMREEV